MGLFQVVGDGVREGIEDSSSSAFFSRRARSRVQDLILR